MTKAEAVLEESGAVITVPEAYAHVDANGEKTGKPPRHFVHEGGHYEHASEDAEGRWVYRRMHDV